MGEITISDISAGNNIGPNITSILKNQNFQRSKERAIVQILVDINKAVVFGKVFGKVFDLSLLKYMTKTWKTIPKI